MGAPAKYGDPNGIFLPHETDRTSPKKYEESKTLPLPTNTCPAAPVWNVLNISQKPKSREKPTSKTSLTETFKRAGRLNVRPATANPKIAASAAPHHSGSEVRENRLAIPYVTGTVNPTPKIPAATAERSEGNPSNHRRTITHPTAAAENR